MGILAYVNVEQEADIIIKEWSRENQHDQIFPAEKINFRTFKHCSSFPSFRIDTSTRSMYCIFFVKHNLRKVKTFSVNYQHTDRKFGDYVENQSQPAEVNPESCPFETFLHILRECEYLEYTFHSFMFFKTLFLYKSKQLKHYQSIAAYDIKDISCIKTLSL